MSAIKVCVFGSSSSKTPKMYLDAAEELGRLIATRNYICVNGGGSSGVMGALNEGCTQAKGHIIGVIHEMFVVDSQEDTRIQDLIVVRGGDLKERKQQLLDNGDCLIVMPGGVGTLDELWDAVCTKSLGLGGLKDKPISVVNVNGFFDGSIAQLKRSGDDGLLHRHESTYFQVHSSVQESLDWCVEQLAANSLGASNGQSSNPAVRVRGAQTSSDVVTEMDLQGQPTTPKLKQSEAHSKALFQQPVSKRQSPKLWYGIAIGICVGLLLGEWRRK